MSAPEPDERPHDVPDDAGARHDVPDDVPDDAGGERRRVTPGRVLLILAIAAVVLVVLFTWVFPWIERNLSNPTLQALTPLL